MMKPNALFSPAPITRAVVLEKLQQLDKQLRDKRSERDALRATLPTIIAGAAGSDLAAKRERKRLAELADEIRDLQAAEPVLRAALADLDHAEALAAFEAQRRAVAQLAEAHQAIAEETQRCIEQALAPLLCRYQESYERFRSALHRAGKLREACDTDAHYAEFSRHVGLSLYLATEGAVRVHRIIDTPTQLRERGWGSLSAVAKEHLAVCMRAFPLPPVQHTPPEAA